MSMLYLFHATPLAAKDMDEMRGGFIDPSGLLLRFAVDVRTLVDGSVAFIRSLVIQPDQSGQLQATGNTQLLTQNLPSGATASLIDNGKGIIITDPKGQTTVINQTTQGAFTNIILNAASDRAVTQNMNVDIVLRNMQSAMGVVSTATAHMGGFSALTLIARSHAAGL